MSSPNNYDGAVISISPKYLELLSLECKLGIGFMDDPLAFTE